MVNGKSHERGLGAYPQVSLKEARQKAGEIADELRAGNTAIGKRMGRPSVERQIPTFRQLGEEYRTLHEASWKHQAHRDQWKQTLRDYVYPIIGDMPVDQITRADVKRALDPIWTTKHETARNTMDRIRMVLGYAKAHDFRSGDNPADWKDGLSFLLPKVARKVRHHPMLPIELTPQFMKHLWTLKSTSARALQFCILTATRTAETLGARRSEIDGDIWTIPEERMKGGKAHRVPLSKEALALIEKLPVIADHEDILFPGGSTGGLLSQMGMLQCLRGLRDQHFKGMDLTVHGFRATFRSWVAAKAIGADGERIPEHVAEEALAHAIPDAVKAAYRRTDFLDDRRLVMQQWADFAFSFS